MAALLALPESGTAQGVSFPEVAGRRCSSRAQARGGAIHCSTGVVMAVVTRAISTIIE
jgi:hypothetical protein